MNILICSKLFYPSNAIGAVRPSNFAKYLSMFGHTVTVITDEVQQNKEIEFQGIRIIRISNSKFMKCIMNFKLKYSSPSSDEKIPINVLSPSRKTSGIRKKSAILNSLQTYKNFRRQVYDFIIQIDWYLSAKNSLQFQFQKNSFDVAVSSFGPYESFLLGYFTIKSEIAKHWISDLRDNMLNSYNPFWLKVLCKISENKMAKKADAITLVSLGQAEIFRKSVKRVPFDLKKIYIIYNGYEKQIKSIQKINQDKILRISYTGELYGKRRSFGLFFNVLNDMIEENLIDPSRIVFNYAGKSSADFNEQLIPYRKIKEVCHNLGFVNRESAIEIQNNSDILIALTWNNDKELGVLSGKFIEYFQAFKPIISITNGNIANAELSLIICKLKLGIACEYATYQRDYNRLKEYLLMQYIRIQKGELLFYEPNIKEMKQFHYKKLAEKLENICLSITKKPNLD